MEHTKRCIPIPRWKTTAGFILPLLLAALFHLLKHNQQLMAVWVFQIIGPVEQFLGRLCSFAPFSVGEFLLGLFLVLCILWLIRALLLLAKERSPLSMFRRISALLSAALWIWAGLCWLWNAAYYAPSFSQRSGLAASPCSVEQLAAVTESFANHAASLSKQVRRDQDGHFSESIQECSVRAPEIYGNLTSEFPFLSLDDNVVKPLMCSRFQSFLGFTGIYSPITGEANINVDAPACLIPATMAHEMSHQRMIASEDEANFVGIAACIRCDDVVFQYSGYLMGLIHLCNALYSVSPDTWYGIAELTFTPELSQDWNDNNAYWSAHSSPLEETAEQIYDSFLKGNDQKLGTRSYGACVNLLVQYFG